MIDKTMYRIVTDNQVIWSTEQPVGADYVIKHRLIADEGKVLTNGQEKAPCIDIITGEVSDWWEIEEEEEE